jgi:branched-chain amino acid transport system ATP-binding protein
VTVPAERKVKLRIEGLSVSSGGVKALDNVSLEVYENEILAIIGAERAGKTTLLNCVTGFQKPHSGEIYYEGKIITRIRPHKTAQLGIARTFQNIELYPGLSTLDNLMAARHVMMTQNFLTGAIFYGTARGEEIDNRRSVEDIIDFLELESVRKNVVGTLPYPVRKRVELGRALAMEPDVLLLDEPMAGMKAEEKKDFTRLVLDIFKGQGETVYPRTPVLRDGIKCIVLFERDLDAVKDIAQRIVVLDSGKIIAEGKPQEI